MAAQPRSIQLELVLALALLGAACRTRTPPPTPPPTAPRPQAAGPQGQLAADAPITPQRLADGEPPRAYRTLAPGLLARTGFAAPAEKGAPFAVEVWDVMVGPGQTSENARLPGAAVVEVRSGTGVLRVGDQARELRTGTTATLDEGADFTLTNSDREAPLILRVTLIRAVRP